MNRRLTCMLCVGVIVFGATSVTADEVLLYDNFSGPQLDTGSWGLANWNIGDKTQFGNTPQFATDTYDGADYISLPLDTYNPANPGTLVLGTEIYSLQNFDLGEGVEYVARARLASETAGLVAAFFTYNQKRRRGQWLSDEIDFEVLSKQATDGVLVTSWNDWGAPGSTYEDGVHHLGAFLQVPGYDWRDWNIYTIRWLPDHVEWWVNDELVHSQDSPVPDLAQPVRASLWAGGSTWPDAYDAAIAPVADPARNVRHEWQVDYIMVNRLGTGGGGGGGGGALSAPSGLTGTVDGNTVDLGWTDESDNEDGFRIYRAYQPKGRSQPDFKLIATTSADVTGFADTVVDSKYLYYVTAFNAADESGQSNTVEVSVGSSHGSK